MSVSECGELDRLATAAASLDYSVPLVNPGQRTEQEHGTHVNNQENHTVIATNSSQVISYIDPYPLRGQQIVPVRAYESYSQENIQATMQPLPSSRIVMVAQDGNHSGFQFARPVTHFTVAGVTGVHYQNSSVITDGQSSSTLVTHEPIHYEIYKEMPEPVQCHTEVCEEEPPPPPPSTKRPSSKRLAKASAKKKQLEQSAEPSTSEREHFCQDCDLQFNSEYELKEHCYEHKFANGPREVQSKRSGLTLERKVDIIKRVTAGEKRADIAEEYNVNKSTIKSIMKKSENYLSCWKKGNFNPETMRMKGPKREDVEQALYSWYKQAIDNGTHVSGPTLCSKALDFANKLGYNDFKPSHGWLDRFKKRKKIVFGRVPSKRIRDPLQSDDVRINEWQGTILPQVVYEYDSNNIFAVEKMGLLYKASPSTVPVMSGKRCAGGIHAADRVSVLLCTNMLGKEKLPVLVVGSCRKVSRTHYTRSLPVHYVYHEKAWLTREIFIAWLQDVDSWLIRQNRKICLIAANSPVHTNLPKLQSIRFVVTPTGVPCPLQQLSYDTFKRFYRMSVLEQISDYISRESNDDPTTNVVALSLVHCLSLIAKAWQSVPENFSVSSFQRSGITRYGVWAAIGTQDIPHLFGAQDLITRLASYGYCSNLSFDNYVHFDDNLQVCNMMADEDILAEVKGVGEVEIEPESIDDQGENTPTLSQLDEAFNGLRKLAQYREGGEEAFRLISHLENLLQKGVASKPPAKKQWFPENP